MKILSVVAAALVLWTVSAHACPMHEAQANATLEPAAGDAGMADQDAAGDEPVEAVIDDSQPSGVGTPSGDSHPANSMYWNLNQ